MTRTLSPTGVSSSAGGSPTPGKLGYIRIVSGMFFLKTGVIALQMS